MKQRTILRRLAGLLSGKGKRLFPNQVVFYHALFAFTQKNICPDSLCEQIRTLIYREELSKLPLSAPLYQQLLYIVTKSLDGDTANIGKHINNHPDYPIPQLHQEHYLVANGREVIQKRLQTVVQFFWLRRRPEVRLLPEDLRELLQAMKRELGDGQGISQTLEETEQLNPEVMAQIIYETVRAHLFRIVDSSFPKESPVMQIDEAAQRQEWELVVNSHGSRNMDRFLDLKRLADTNVFAAEELGTQYYYGAEYIVTNEGDGSDGIYRVPQDYRMAVRYFQYAADCVPHSLSASWSMGYMLLNGFFPELSEEESSRQAVHYLKICQEAEYAPAINGLGNLEKRRGDRLLEKTERTQQEQREMLEHFAAALRYFDRSSRKGWVYAYSNLGAFFENERYLEQVLPFLGEDFGFDGPRDARYYWMEAAKKDNTWALDQVARIDFARGDYLSAKNMWERAAALHYPDGYRKLAEYFYSPSGIWPDGDRWFTAMTQASIAGSAQASLKLAEHMEREYPVQSLGFLEKAKEQNAGKFSQELYQKILELQERLEKQMA